MNNPNNHYSVEEIKKRFIGNDWGLAKEEYEILWETLSLLKKRHVDILQKEIYLIVLGLQKNKKSYEKSHKGLYIKLRDIRLLRRKKGVIILSPFFFGDERDENWRDNRAWTILHELAHHALKHTSVFKNKDRESAQRNEKVAKNLSSKWAEELNLHFWP